ncbi:hypothetical protein [Achromobacter xylosoxidans]|uniref:AbiU2 domain-containing protein n=1 Tax=Alcaligenes xylosoxydans xylosoxydans TaxID=85698 RepID=UPI000AD9FDB7|nr:hypothetical protein [Achromobacter xylosoxidans]
MDDIQREIERMQKLVDVIRQEIELAVMFHETWRPSACDTDLHMRIGASYAGHAFLIIRLSLRRELLLALNRVWDTHRKSVRMGLIADRLRSKEFFDALVQYRAQRSHLKSDSAHKAIKTALVLKRDQVLALISKYSEGGNAARVLEKLTKVRHEHLAHRQLPNEPAAIDRPNPHGVRAEAIDLATVDEIEAFYQDNLQLVSLLLSLVQGHAYDLSETAGIYKHHANFFWASARGERTEGHPDFRAPPPDI